MTNSGTISGEFGIVANNTATVTNSGTISGGTGIFALTANVTNAGLISGGAAALQFSLSADTLTLLPGSTIVGAIGLGGGGDTVNFRTGNQNLTFDTLAGATVTSTVPFAVAGNQVATIDPTPFAVLDRNLMDFSRAVSQALADGEGVAGPGLVVAAPGPAMAFAASPPGEAVMPGLSAYGSDAAAIFEAPPARYGDGTRMWARGFAGQRVQEAEGPLPDRFHGGMLGGDWQAWPDWRLGAFVGAGRSARAWISIIRRRAARWYSAGFTGAMTGVRGFCVLRCKAGIRATIPAATSTTIWCRVALSGRRGVLAAGM